MNLILASSSKYRAQLLKQAGYNPIIVKPHVDESAIKVHYKNQSPLYIAQILARRKAEKVAQMIVKEPMSFSSEDSPIIIIGSDQVCVFNNDIFDKPETFENNFIHLKKLQGQMHSLITCVCLIIFKIKNPTTDDVGELIDHKNENPYSQILEFYNKTDLIMKPLTDSQIVDYLKLDQPFDCAGGYRFESHGHGLMEKVLTEDESSIQGLPMIETLKHLQRFTND